MDTVRRLLAAQQPALASLPVRPVRSLGTVNAVFRLGDDLCVRVPRVPDWAESLDREWRWLPLLGPHLPLAIPEPVAWGTPDDTFPLPWAVLRWIDGETYADDVVADEAAAARALAGFVTALRRIDPTGAPVAGRRPLRELDAQTRAAIASVPDLLDARAAIAAWDRALDAPPWTGAPVWIHGDLLRPNLLVRDGRLVAVIDFGGVGGGDPATDLLAAWAVLGLRGRQVLRQALEADDGTWERARGIALHQAALIVPYYRDTNPAFAALAVRTVERVLADVARARA
ncbi:aminoglycoside phosphotransferase [Cellulomonas aerilata]|uniref:Aminoglycoside phosphotransferase n=1 Tax=Cellulomonas aerilata TaxID=515326 RepID=A0A512D7X9_9CELL|nr:aminoglycoside phosphotransferase [Cellulomonas aerilata]